MLDIEFPVESVDKLAIDMPSLNHSYVCSQILKQLFAYSEFEALTELTLDIDNGLTPNICVYPAELIQPNFLRDIHKVQQMPVLAIEVISASQNIQSILEKSERMVNAGIKSVWSIEPFTRAIFVTNPQGERIFYNQIVESENITIDFERIFTSPSLSKKL